MTYSQSKISHLALFSGLIQGVVFVWVAFPHYHNESLASTHVENPMTGMACFFKKKIISLLQKFLITTVEMFVLGIG